MRDVFEQDINVPRSEFGAACGEKGHVKSPKVFFDYVSELFLLMGWLSTAARMHLL